MSEPPRAPRLIVDRVVILDPHTGTLHKRGHGLMTECGLMPRIATIGAAHRILSQVRTYCDLCWPAEDNNEQQDTMRTWASPRSPSS
jgi:hypothetical protein